MRCRFAPSPTGLIHVGNVRSAILNWAYSKKNQGEFLLRIDDTDLARSEKNYELKIKENLNWLGIHWDKTFNQSARKKLYEEKILILQDTKRLYPCFETEEELALKKKSLLSSGKPPIYDRSALNLSQDEINKNINNGKKPYWRFKLDDKSISWLDLIKGEVKFDSKNLNDPVLIRADGTFLYHLPSVVDDIEEGITDIIRGEDHISNTAFHIQLFQALKSQVPNFAHHPFLIDNEGKNFAKRSGSLSIENLKDNGYENISILNYLINIGSSQEIKPYKNIENLVSSFDLKNISNSSPKFSDSILKSLNKDTLKMYSFNDISSRVDLISENFSSELLWNFVHNNIDFFHEIKNWIKIIKNENNLNSININSDLIDVAISVLPNEPFNEYSWDNWINNIKLKSNYKGRDLFMSLRLALTGMDKGPELKYLLPLLNKEIILKKFGKL